MHSMHSAINTIETCNPTFDSLILVSYWDRDPSPSTAAEIQAKESLQQPRLTTRAQSSALTLRLSLTEPFRISRLLLLAAILLVGFPLSAIVFELDCDLIGM